MGPRQVLVEDDGRLVIHSKIKPGQLIKPDVLVIGTGTCRFNLKTVVRIDQYHSSLERAVRDVVEVGLTGCVLKLQFQRVTIRAVFK